MWPSGSAVALRRLNRGRPSHVWPVTVVEDSRELTALYVAAGTPTRRRSHVGGTPIERSVPYADRYLLPWELGDGEWYGSSCLQLQRPGEARSWWRWLDRDGWYVNLQSPLVRTAVGFDTVDHVLDVVVEHGSWSWKDEDEFADAKRIGAIGPEEADAIRSAGEEAVAAIEARTWPLGVGWEEWRPDPSWPIPQLDPAWEREPLSELRLPS